VSFAFELFLKERRWFEQRTAALEQAVEEAIVAAEERGRASPPKTSNMTAAEAVIYCLGHIDGCFSEHVIDKNGGWHWIVWAKADLASPKLKSDSPYPFCPRFEPYRAAWGGAP